MKPARSFLAAALLVSTLAACDTMNNFHDSVQVEDTTKDVYFSGQHGKSQSFCGPSQRQRHVCY